MTRALLAPVAVTDLPEYPFGPEDRLDGNSFVKWHTTRWLGSRTFKLMPWDMQGMARALFDMAQLETPIGTLPDDDDELAFMLRCDARRIRELRGLEYGPMRNWQRCRCDGAVRLMHPVVVEVISDALTRRNSAALAKDAKAVAQRMARLRRALAAEGCSDAVLGDDVLLRRIDGWLEENHRSNRTRAVYRSALLHAQQQRWFGPGAGRTD